MTQTPLAIVILAAGKGTRMKSALPKVMHKIAGRPMIHWILASAKTLNPDKIVVVTAPDMDDVARAIAPYDIAIQAQQKGTGDAARAALPALKGFKGRVLILLGDEPFLDEGTLRAMIAHDGLSVMAVKVDDPSGLGRMIVSPDGTLQAIVEDKDTNTDQKSITLCNAGNFCAPFEFLENWLSKLESKNAQGEFYLTDMPMIAARDGIKTRVIESPPVAAWGINTRTELAAHENTAQKMLRQWAMEGGATLIDPDTVYFSFDTILGRDVVVEPNVFFGTGVTIGDGCIIHAFSHLEGVVVESYASIGPFARLRTGTRIGERARVGNFVEVKNTNLGAGSKANHLAYLGDSSIGARANIGAGTITCNYDGFDKHRTEIGEEVFVGSNSTLVAPITLSDGAYIAAGSVVTHDVPENALLIARARSLLKEGWASLYRSKKKKA